MANPFTPEQISQILEAFFETVGTRQYIGARYVPIFGRKGETSIQWNNSAPYEPLTIVLYQGNSYTSRQYVPTGVEITNTDYWALTGNFNGQIASLEQDIINFERQVNTDISDFELQVNNNFSELSQNFQEQFDSLVDTTEEEIGTLEDRLDNAISLVSDTFAGDFYHNFKRKNGTKLFTIAHRGFRNAFVPENTVEAFGEACKCYPDMVETDIYFTSDDEIVCMHDNNVGNYISQLNGAPADYTLQQIKQYPIDLGSGVTNYPNCFVPTLDEVLVEVSKYGAPLLIELKEPNLTTARINKIIAAIENANYIKSVAFSGTYANCVLVYQILKTGLFIANISSVSQTVINNLKTYSFGAQLDINAATQENVETLIQNGIPFNVWFRGDVSSTASYATMLSYGVYAMFFDDITKANACITNELSEYMNEFNYSVSEFMKERLQTNNIMLATLNGFTNPVPSYGYANGKPSYIKKNDFIGFKGCGSLVIAHCDAPRSGIQIYERTGDSVNQRNGVSVKTRVSNNGCDFHWHTNVPDELMFFFTETQGRPSNYTNVDFATRIFKSNIIFAATGSVGSNFAAGNNVFSAPELIADVSEKVTFWFNKAIMTTYQVIYGVYFYDSDMKRVAGTALPYTNVAESEPITVGPFTPTGTETKYMVGFRIRPIGDDTSSNIPNFTSAIDNQTYQELIEVFRGASFATFTEIV